MHERIVNSYPEVSQEKPLCLFLHRALDVSKDIKKVQSISIHSLWKFVLIVGNFVTLHNGPPKTEEMNPQMAALLTLMLFQSLLQVVLKVVLGA